MDLREFENFREWVPVRGDWRENQAYVDWCFVGKERFTEPFFDDSISKRLRQPFNLLFRHQTPMKFLGELNEYSKGLKPDGFIFHLSRCGSTLVSQMLAALPQNIVISEAPPLDFVLRSGEVCDEIRVEWLRWMINAFGQKRSYHEENFFIKFDSWNTRQINLIKRAFPDVPWIFLYRNPVEIMVSHIRRRGAHMIPWVIKGILPELSFEESLQLPPEEYFARVLGKVCESVLDSLIKGEGLAVNYTELPQAVPALILKHFKVELNRKDVDKMFETAKFNAKNPYLSFSADSESKKNEASRTALAAAEKYVNPYYEEFELIGKKR
jgi:hypothetical protein